MEDTGIRRTVYMVHGQAITLAFIGCVADEHPPIDEKGRTLGGPQQPKAERAPYLTADRIRRALGMDPKYSEAIKDRVGFEATMHRISREGF